MSPQRARSGVEASHRSIHPNIPGVPWWAALLIALGATAIGFAIDAGSGHKELTHVFAGFYVAGCVAAVLAVRQEGVFTAVIQPPLILFCAVPGGYWLFHGGKVGHLKDLLINCGYPLIERFPLMLGTAGGVLLIGLIRWYLGMSHRTIAVTTAEEAGDTAKAAEVKSFVSGIVAKLQSAVRRDPEERDADGATSSEARRARSARRRVNTRQSARSDRAGTRSTRTRVPPSPEDPQEPGRPRRPGRASQAGPRDFDPADPPRRPRRPRPQGEPERGQPRREPRTRRSPYERPAPRGSRFDGFDTYQPPGTPEQFDRYAPYEPHEGFEPGRRRAGARGTNGADPTHHPISRVRYRGEAPLDETGAERPTRSRASGRSRGRPPAESWEYDR
ncbi:MAG: DUF6542 domain-containing protein [Mycobacterium sp.]|uniref:DUF6542 domain-containing protein n=1 Tax=Mycobacterium sp. TaxID=1785 RepID=UPI003F99D16E